MAQEINGKSNATRYAWAQYFKAVNRGAMDVRNILNDISESVDETEKKIPKHVLNTILDLLEKYKHYTECAICTETFCGSEGLEILIRCGHMFCKECITAHREGREDAKCPVCRTPC